MDNEFATHPSVVAAVQNPGRVDGFRHQWNYITKDVAVTLYERNPDGSMSDTAFLQHSRPQDFAVNPHMKYTVLTSLYESPAQEDGNVYMEVFLIHIYWDGDRDEQSAVNMVMNEPTVYAYGHWQPTAPSDPLLIDDMWNHDLLGEPPNGWWHDIEDTLDEGARIADVFFDNFARSAHLKVPVILRSE